MSMRNWEVWRLLIAITSVYHLTNTHCDRELCAIRKTHKHLFPEVWVLNDKQFYYHFANDFGELKFCLRHCSASALIEPMMSLIRGSGQAFTTLQVWLEKRNRKLGNLGRGAVPR